MTDEIQDELCKKSAYWTSETVNARLRDGFESASYAQAGLVLAGLAPAPDCPPEADETACRLMLAAIRVSEGSIHKLAMWVEVARIDPRDLLAAAEFPKELQEGTQESRAEDLASYLNWVAGPPTRVE